MIDSVETNNKIIMCLFIYLFVVNDLSTCNNNIMNHLLYASKLLFQHSIVTCSNIL
jgi:hypothetical protein